MLHVTLTKSPFHSFFGMETHVQCTVHVPEHQKHNTWIKKYMYSPQSWPEGRGFKLKNLHGEND